MSATLNKLGRVSAPVSNQSRELLQQAADLVGSTLSQFIIQSALDKAQQLIENETVIHLSRSDAEVLFKTLENPPPPNLKLRKAVATYKQSPLYDSYRSTAQKP